MIGHEKRRDYRKVGLSTLFILIFLFICILLDRGEAQTHYLVWLSLKRDFLSVYWPKNSSNYLFTVSLPFSTLIDTMIPLMPLAVVIAYVNKLGQYLNLNPFYFHGHRIHHYHIGIITAVFGLFLASLNPGAETFLLNGKETNLMEISQGLGLCFLIGGIIFILIDSKDFRGWKHKNA